jgi:hypothetical protein
LLSMPVSVKGAVRSLSKLKLIKTYLTSHMSQENWVLYLPFHLKTLPLKTSISTNWWKLLQMWKQEKSTSIDAFSKNPFFYTLHFFY